LGAQTGQLHVQRALDFLESRPRMLASPFGHRVVDFMVQGLPALREFV
jgi:hypothetical protein